MSVMNWEDFRASNRVSRLGSLMDDICGVLLRKKNDVDVPVEKVNSLIEKVHSAFTPVIDYIKGPVLVWGKTAHHYKDMKEVLEPLALTDEQMAEHLDTLRTEVKKLSYDDLNEDELNFLFTNFDYIANRTLTVSYERTGTGSF